jgi:hypothetical protein
MKRKNREDDQDMNEKRKRDDDDDEDDVRNTHEHAHLRNTGSSDEQVTMSVHLSSVGVPVQGTMLRNRWNSLRKIAGIEHH